LVISGWGAGRLFIFLKKFWKINFGWVFVWTSKALGGLAWGLLAK
jgi:hypothetical protein